MSKSNAVAMIDREALQAELQELAGDRKVRVRIDPQGQCAAGVRETDKRVDIYLNPKRIRGETKLQKHIDWIRGQLL